MTATLDRAVPGVDRFAQPLYTVTEAARYLDVPKSTFHFWAYGNPRTPGAPVVTAVASSGPYRPVVPFVGLAEGLVLAAMRRSGVPLQRIRPALMRLQEEFGLAHALASRRLYTDGAEVLYDYAQHGEDRDAGQAAGELVVVRSGQRVFNEVVLSYLSRVEFDQDGYARLIRLPAYSVAELVVDTARGFGQPVFARGGARLEDALALFRAGESLEVVAGEYGMPLRELEDAVRAATRLAA